MLLPFFEWMGGLWSLAPFSESVWATPVLQNIHLLAVAVFVGAVLVVDIRMLGHGLRETPLAQLARSVEPWLIGSFVVLVLTGIPQIASTPANTATASRCMFCRIGVAQTDSLTGPLDQSSPIHSKNGNSIGRYSSSNPTHQAGMALRRSCGP